MGLWYDLVTEPEGLVGFCSTETGLCNGFCVFCRGQGSPSRGTLRAKGSHGEGKGEAPGAAGLAPLLLLSVGTGPI